MCEDATPVSDVMAHVFVVRGEEILIVREAFGWRWWGQPGGHADPGETPAEAAIRETLEETGLRIDAPELLRTWSYRGQSGVEHECYTFVASAPEGEIRLSDEHTEYAWMTADQYAERHCSPEPSAVAPEYAHFFDEMRRDCAALKERLAAPNARG